MAFDLGTIQRRMKLISPDQPDPAAPSGIQPQSVSQPASITPSAAPTTPAPAAYSPSSFVTSTPNAQTSAVGSTPLGYQQGSYQSPVLHYNDIPQTDYKNVNDFDFDRAFTDQTDALSRQQADAQQQYDLANQQDVENYNRSLRGISDQSEQVFDANADKMANQGILRSGVSVRESGNIGQDLQNQIDALNRQRTEGNNQRETSFATVQRQIAEQLGRLQEEHTRRQQELEIQRAQQAAAAQAAQEAAAASQAAVQPWLGNDGSYNPPMASQQPANSDLSWGRWTYDDQMNPTFLMGGNNAGQSLAGAAQGGYNYGDITGETAPYVNPPVVPRPATSGGYRRF